METGLSDIELILLAINHGLITEAQVVECLNDRDKTTEPEKRKALHEVVIEKGILSRSQFEDLARRHQHKPDEQTISMAAIRLICTECGNPVTLPLEIALRDRRCHQCSGRLEGKARTEKSNRGVNPIPPDVQEALKDPKSKFSKYVILAKAGQGAMGEVYKAWDSQLNRYVALKVPKGGDEEQLKRFQGEAKGTARLSHANIASIYEVAEFEGRPFIAMQFINGATAEKKALEAAGKTDLREVVRWIRDVALGVHYAHENGVIHRDVKPANIMIDKDDRVYIMDFGLAKDHSSDGDQTVSGVILGTPSFMAPEQAAGHVTEIEPRSDVYSLGSSLYVLLTGKKPFAGASVSELLVNILTTEPAPLRQINSAIPWELEAIVSKAMQRNRTERYASAKDFAADLTRFLVGEPIQAKRATLRVAFKRKFKSRPETFIIAACLLVLAILLLFVFPSKAPPSPDRGAEWSRRALELKKAIRSDGFNPESAAALIKKTEAEFPAWKSEIDSMVAEEHRRIVDMLEGLDRSRWLESRAKVTQARTWLLFMKKPVDRADAILAYRGRCTLVLNVHPYAEIRGTMVGALPPEDRFTPLVLRDVEISADPLELVHPEFGKRALKTDALQNGKKYVIDAEWKGSDSFSWREEQ